MILHPEVDKRNALGVEGPVIRRTGPILDTLNARFVVAECQDDRRSRLDALQDRPEMGIVEGTGGKEE